MDSSLPEDMFRMSIPDIAPQLTGTVRTDNMFRMIIPDIAPQLTGTARMDSSLPEDRMIMVIIAHDTPFLIAMVLIMDKSPLGE